MDEDHFVFDEDYSFYTAPRRGRDIDFLIALRIEYRNGMNNDLIPGGMAKLLRMHNTFVSPGIMEPLRDYESLTIDSRGERLKEASERLKKTINDKDGIIPPISSEKFKVFKKWLATFHDV